MLQEGKRKSQNIRIMANYASNLLFASTENEKDLEKMAEFLRENFLTVMLIGMTSILTLIFLHSGVIPKE